MYTNLLIISEIEDSFNSISTNRALMTSLGKHDNYKNALQEYITRPLEKISRPCDAFVIDSGLRNSAGNSQLYHIFNIGRASESNEYFTRPSSSCVISVSIPGDWTQQKYDGAYLLKNPLIQAQQDKLIAKELIRKKPTLPIFPSKAQLCHEELQYEPVFLTKTPEPVDLLKMTKAVFKTEVTTYCKNPQDTKEVDRFVFRSLSDIFNQVSNDVDRKGPYSVPKFVKMLQQYISKEVHREGNLKEINSTREENRVQIAKANLREFNRKYTDVANYIQKVRPPTENQLINIRELPVEHEWLKKGSSKDIGPTR